MNFIISKTKLKVEIYKKRSPIKWHFIILHHLKKVNFKDENLREKEVSIEILLNIYIHINVRNKLKKQNKIIPKEKEKTQNFSFSDTLKKKRYII